jgi:hypothetical protein
MKSHLALAALGAAMIMGGCVAYPVDGYHDHRNYRDGYRHDNRGDWHQNRDRDRERYRNRGHAGEGAEYGD